jgi:uncharacterized OB-fold protein
MSKPQSSQDKRVRPAPSAEPFLAEIEAKPFWDNLREHRLTAQRCNSCGGFSPFPPQAMCPKCLSSEVEWVPVSGKGTVYSFVTYHRAWHPAYQDKIPYNVSLIDLEEGPRLVSNVVDIPPEDVRVGIPVEVVYEDHEEYTLPKFRPTKPAS